MIKSIIVGVLLMVVYLVLYFVELSPDQFVEYSVFDVMEGHWHVEAELPMEEIVFKIEGEMNKGYFVGRMSSVTSTDMKIFTGETMGIEIEAYYRDGGIRLIKPEVISSTYSMESMEEMLESVFGKEEESEKLDSNIFDSNFYTQVNDINFGYTDQSLSLKPRLEINNQYLLSEEISLIVTLIIIKEKPATMEYRMFTQEEKSGTLKLTNIQ